MIVLEHQPPVLVVLRIPKDDLLLTGRWLR